MVQEGRGMPPSMFGLTAKPLCGRYLSFAEREEIALLRVQGYSMQEVARRLGRVASTISRELRRATPPPHPKRRPRGVIVRRTAQWHAERAARRPKQAKACARNAALRTYVEERLAGVVVAPSGAPAVPGPVVSWKSRRHGPRKDRRDGQTPGARSRSPVARRWTSRTTRPCASAMKPSIKRCSFKVEARCGPRSDGLPAHRARVADAEGAHARARQGLHLSRDHDQPTSGGGSRSRRAGPLGRRPLSWVLGVLAIGTLVERTTRFTLLLYLPRMAGHGHEARVKNGPALAGHGARGAVRDAISRTIVTCVCVCVA